MTVSPPLVYRLDHRDAVVFVNDVWNEHALSAKSAQLVGARVLERSLWDFITDATTEHVYRELFRRVRGGSVVTFEFQCDAPQERRRLEMKILPLFEGGLELRTRVLAREPRQPISVFYTNESSSWHPRMCSWCKRVEVQGKWVALEEAIAELALFRRSRLPTFTHGLCPSCGEGLAAPEAAAPDYFAGE